MTSMKPDISQTNTSKQTETKSEIGGRKTKEDDVHVMELRDNDGTSTAVETVHNRCVQKLLVVSLGVTQDKIRNVAGRDTLDEVVVSTVNNSV